MNFSATISFLSASFVMATGLLVLFKDAKSRLNVVFSLFCASIAIWLFGTAMMFLNKEVKEMAIFWDRFVYVGGVFIPTLLYHFDLQFTQTKKRHGFLYLGYGLSLFFLIMSRTDYFVKDLFYYNWGVHTKAQFFHHIFVVIFFTYVGLFFSHIYLFYKNSKNAVERQRTKYILLAFGILFGIGLLALLPAYNIGIYPVPFFAGLFFTAVVAYAIVKHRLFDIEIIVRQGTILALILAVIIFIFVLATSLLTRLLGGYAILIPAVIITFGFIPFKNFLEKVIDKFFFRSRYDFQTATHDMIKTFSKIEDLDKLLEEFLKKLVGYLKVPKAEIVLLLEKDHFISRLSIGVGGQTGMMLPKNNVLVQHLEKHPDEILEKDYLGYLAPKEEHHKDELLKLHKEFEKMGYALAAPITVKRVVIGILFLGEKISRDIFSSQDIQLLEIIGRQAGPVIESARLYEQTQELNKELMTANQAKSHFITVVSHQFRTPLSGIRMTAELLEDNLKKRFMTAEDEIESVQVIQERAIFMVNILENIFDAMAIDAHKVSVDKKPAVMWEIFENVKKGLNKEIEKKRINFILDKSPELLQEIHVDISKITKVVAILLENAVTYNKENGIVEIKIDNTIKNGKKFIQCGIRDEGIGVPAEDARKIFEKFYRSPNAINLVPNGTGLGLFIAKNFVELHGGKLWVISQPGQGSTFYFTLPEE